MVLGPSASRLPPPPPTHHKQTKNAHAFCPFTAISYNATVMHGVHAVV
jgi:hypothetical protein